MSTPAPIFACQPIVAPRPTPTRLAVPEHTLNSPQGSLTLWVAALDGIDVAPPPGSPGICHRGP